MSSRVSRTAELLLPVVERVHWYSLFDLVRLFEAAACGATIVSDRWEGLDSFFVPGEEILLPESSSDAVRYLGDMDEAEIQRIGDNAQARVLAAHTAQQRALQFEDYVASVRFEPKALATVTGGTPARN
jgi:spore maturation protein CgeB